MLMPPTLVGLNKWRGEMIGEKIMAKTTLRKTTIKKSSKVVYFTDLTGEQVAMNTQRLTELPNEYRLFDWFTTPKELRAAAKCGATAIRIFRLGCPEGVLVDFGPCFDDATHFHIGCHAFSKTIFNRILRRAGVKV
jgi:hypothetical protein